MKNNATNLINLFKNHFFIITIVIFAICILFGWLSKKYKQKFKTLINFINKHINIINLISPAFFFILFFSLKSDIQSMIILGFWSIFNFILFTYINYDRGKETPLARFNYLILAIIFISLLLILILFKLSINIKINILNDLFMFFFILLIIFFSGTFFIKVEKPKHISPLFVSFIIAAIFGYFLLKETQYFFLIITLLFAITNIVFKDKNLDFIHVKNIPKINFDLYQFILNLYNTSFIIFKLFSDIILNFISKHFVLESNSSLHLTMPMTASTINTIGEITAGITIFFIITLITIALYSILFIIGLVINFLSKKNESS